MPKQLNVNLSMTADTGKAQAELQKLQQALKQLSVTSLKSENLGLTKEIQAAIKDVNELQVKLQSATSATGGLDLGKFSSNLSKGNKTLQDYANSLSALGPKGKEAFAQLTQSIVTAEVPLKRSSSLLSNFATTLKNTARWQLSSSVLHGFMGAIQGAVSYAQDLNESLNSIRIVTGQTTDQMASFAEKANKAAQTLSTTTTAYTDAALIFYQQGLGDKDVEERTNAVIKMANVTGDAASEVSSYMTAIWNNFDDGSESLEHYADVITALGASTASSSAEIAAGLEKFASVAETIGLSYNYSTAALATIVANTRQSADTVGTGLRTIFSRLQGLSLGETLDDGTDLNKYSKALKTVGVDILDASGKMKDMDTILTDLAGKWETLSKAQQTALAQTVGGVRQYTNLIALMDNWDDMEINLQTAENSEGSLQEQADIYAESWEAAQKRVKAAWQAIYNDLLDDKIFITALSGLEKFLQGIDGLIDAFGGLSSLAPFLGTILLKTFGNDLANSIDRVFYNIFQGSEIGKKKILELRHTAIKAMTDMQNNDGTAVGAAQAAVYAGSSQYDPKDPNSKLGGQAGIQEALLQKTQALQEAQRSLTAEEEKQVQILLDQNRVLGEEYVNIVKNAEQQRTSAEQQAKDLLMQYQAKQNSMNKPQEEKNDAVQKFKAQIEQVKSLQQQYTALNGFAIRYQKSVSELGTSGSKDFLKVKEAMVSYLQSIRDINPEIQGLDQRIENLANASSVEELQTHFEDLEQEVEDLGVKAYQTADGLRELGNGAGVPNIDAQVDTLLNNFGALGTLTDRQIQTFANFGMQVDQATNTIKNLDGSVVSLSQGFVSGAQAGMSYAMALSSAKSFGDQLFDQDVSPIQKIIAGFMALTSAISAVNNVSKAAATISAALTNAKQQETVATMKQVAVEKVRNLLSKLIPGLKATEATATAAATAATKAETVAVEANTAAWSIVAVALLAVVAVIGAVSSAMKKNSEEIAENAEKSREAASASKEIVDSNQEVIDSYQEAYEAYLKDKNAKDELIEVSKNVCDQLELEGAALARARGDYEALTKAIYDYQDAELTTAIQKNQRAQNDTASEFVDNMRDGTGRFTGDKYVADIGTIWQSIDDEQIVSDAISNLGNEVSHITDNIASDGTIKVETGQSTEELLQAYEEVLAVVEETERVAGDNTELLNNSENYQAMLDWLDKSKDSYEALMALEDEEAQLRTMQIVNAAVAENQSISTMEEYEQLRQQVIDSLKEEVGLTDEEASAVANTYLKQSAAVKDLADAYSILEDASDVSNIDVGELTDFYNGLNDEEKKVFVSLDFETADSIDDLTKQLNLLQARANKETIKVQLEAVQNAKENFKEGMSATELQNFQTSSGIDWGNEEQEIIKYSDFLAMSYSQQSAYLDQLEDKLSQNLITSTTQIIEEDKALLETYNSDLETAQDNLTSILASSNAQTAQANLETARNTLEALQETEGATAEEIAAAQLAVTEAQQAWDDLTGPAQQEVDDLHSAINNLNTEIENSEEELKITATLETTEITSKMASAESLTELQSLAGQVGNAFTSDLTGTTLGESSYDEYANGLLSIAEKYDSCSEAAEQYQNALNALSSATDENRDAIEQQVKAAQENLEAMIGCEEAAKKYSLEADTLAAQMNEIYLASQDAAEGEKLTKQEALNLAVANQRMNRGVATLVNNWKDWKKILQTTDHTAEDYAATLADVSDAVGELVGWYDDLSLDSKFVEKNMELIDKAATGDVQAILELGAAVASLTVQEAELNTTLADGALASGEQNAFQQYIQGAEDAGAAFQRLQGELSTAFDSIQSHMDELMAGAKLEDILGEGGVEGFVEQLNAYAAATGMTAQEMQSMLSSVGVTANVQSDYQEQEVTVPTYIDQVTDLRYEKFPVTKFDPVTGESFTAYDSVPIYTRGSIPGPPLTDTGYVEVASIQMEGIDGTGAKVQPPKFSGKQAPSKTAKSGGTGNKGGNKGGGGGGSSSAPKYNEEKHKKSSDEKERYHVIKNQLEDLTSQYENISKAKDKAFGSARLANLNKEISAQKRLTQANKEYLNEIESYLSDDKAAVMALGANIDENGTITNYDALIQKAVDDYNAAVDAFNRATTDDEGAQKAFEAAQERYDQFMETISQYEETQDLYKEQMQQVLNDIMTEQSLLLERTQLEVELKINVSEDALEYLEYMMDNIENKAYDCAEAFGYLNGMTQEYFKTAEALEGGLRSLFANQGLTDADFQKLIEGDTATYNKLMDMLSSGGTADLSDGLQQSEIDAAYGFTADDVDTIRDYVSQLIEANKNLQEIRQTVHEQILTVWDEWNEKLDAGIAKIEHLQSITESYQNIIDIVGQKNLGVSNAFMSKMRQQSIDQANDKLEAEKARYESLKKARDDAYAKFEEQKSKGILSPEEIKQWEDSLAQMDEDVQSASEDFQSAWEDALTAANEAFEAAVDQIMQAYDDAAAGLMGSMSDLQDAFDRKSDLSSQYLADYEKIYQLTKLNRDLENSIDSTNNTKAKAELLELQSKINAYEEAGIDISEYQMEQLRQEYELKKAQIELEESQEAKSQVQMTRDADGNYSYVYTANADDVAKAEQNYEDKLHQMQESNANYINDLQSNMIQMEQDYQDKVQEIMKDTSLTAEERMVKLNELNQYYDEKMKFYMSEAELWEENSQRLYEEDWMNYAAATGYKISSEEEWLDHWNETQLSILTGFGSLEEYQTNHNMNVANLLLSSSDAFATWQTNIETAMQNAGTSMGTFQEDATEVLNTVAEESEETKDSVVDMAETAADKIGEVVEAVVDWENQYSATVQKMLTWNNALITSFNRLIAGWSAVQSSANSSGAGSGDGSSSGSGSGSGSSSSSSNNGSNSGNSGDSVDNSDKVAGVAAAIWMDGASASGWGNNPTRATRLKEKGVEGAQAYINAHGANGDIYADWANKRNQLRNYYYGSFDTGGYTGEWGLDGKFAMLHEKELVLNKDDTTHFLQAIDIVRQISELIDLNALSSAGGLSSLLAATASSSSQKLEQQVTIHAEFPNVTDKDQITEAFTDLVNLASQYANRK